jgi:hypothetical protein
MKTDRRAGMRTAPAIASSIVGEWEGEPDSQVGMAATRLHIVQSSDGMLTAWLDRMIALIDQRAGEPLIVVSGEPANITLGLDRPDA